MDYITLDFETANSSFTSACSIGIIGVENGKIILQKHYLINPNELFLDYNTKIHGITQEQCRREKTFKELWPEIKEYFNNTVIFCHNTAFDILVLKSLIEKYNLEAPNIKYGCTVKIASKLWKDILPNFRLNSIANYLGLEHNHHNALSDAMICVGIINRGMKMMSVSDCNSLYEALGLRYGIYNQHRYFGTYQMYKRKNTIDIIINQDLNDKVVIIDGKPSTITKNALIQKLESNGAFVDKTVTLRTDYFVILGNCKKEKLEKALYLKDKGTGIKIITEEEILNLLK